LNVAFFVLELVHALLLLIFVGVFARVEDRPLRLVILVPGFLPVAERELRNV